MNARTASFIAVTATLCLVGACPFDSAPDPDYVIDAGSALDSARPDHATAVDATALDAATVDAAASEDAGNEDAAAANCQQLKEQLRQELSIVGSCTIVVRQQPYGDNLSFQIICGQYRSVSEAQARATAESATGIAASATLLNPSTPADEFVLYDAPAAQGGAAAVSARTGLLVFGATLDSATRSHNAITYPLSWRPAAALGPNCSSSRSIAPELISAYDLEQGASITMPEEWALIAAARLGDSVLLDAMVEAGYIFDLVALHYAPLGSGPDDAAENILLLNGGWLE